MAQARLKLIKSDDEGKPGPRLISTVDPQPSDHQPQPASSGFNIEGALNEFVPMAEMAMDLVDRLFRPELKRPGSGPYDYFIPDRERNHVQFVMTHLVAMIRKEREDYYASIGYDGPIDW